MEMLADYIVSILGLDHAGMTFHDPCGCPRWSSQETVSFDLSGEVSDVKDIHAIRDGPSV